MANLEQTGLDKVISLTAAMLKLHSFYTGKWQSAFFQRLSLRTASILCSSDAPPHAP
jgi:hypothetical protein